MDPITPEEAREQLMEATDRAAVSRSDAAIGATLTGGLGVLLAATLTAVTLWRGNAVGLIVSMGVYMVALALLMWWQFSRYPLVFFINCPTKKPCNLVLPLRYCSSSLGLAAIT